MRIPKLDDYSRKNRRSYFDDLPWKAQQRAYGWLQRFVTRREATHGAVADWLLPIYVGQARRLALNPVAGTGH